MKLPKLCAWCTKFQNDSCELYCTQKCKQYDNVHDVISRTLNNIMINGSSIAIINECNNLYKILFETCAHWYDHRRDDIGFEIFSISQILHSLIKNNYDPNKILVLQQHLHNLLFYLCTTTRSSINA